MSLRLLKKAASASSDGSDGQQASGKGRGRGARRTGTTMSLGQFQQAVGGASATSSASSKPSAWGKGGSKSQQNVESNSYPTPASAGATPKGSGKSSSKGRESAGKAWAQGPPTSAVSALWDAAPPTVAGHISDEWELPPSACPPVAEVYEDDWGLPEEHTQTGDEGSWYPAGAEQDYNNERPAASDEDAYNDSRWEDGPAAMPTARANDDESHNDLDEEDEASPLHADESSEKHVEEGSIGQDLLEWLRILDLTNFFEEALAWFKEMGAASLEEVLEDPDSFDSFLEAMPTLSVVQRNKFVAHGEDALETMQTRRKERGAGNLSSVPSTDASSGAAVHTAGPSGCSYYSRNSQADGPSSTTPNEEEDAPPSAPAAQSQSFYPASEGRVVDDIYIQPEITKVATYEPKAKVSQKELRKQQRDLRSATSEVEDKERESERIRQAAEAKLKAELEREERERLQAFEDALVAAARSLDKGALESAARTAKEKGVSADFIRYAREEYERTRAALEALLSDLTALAESKIEDQEPGFGRQIREAIDAAESASCLPGFAAVKAAAQNTLQEFEAFDRRRTDTQMILHMALLAKDREYLRDALEKAASSGLRDHPMTLEAREMLEDLEEEHRKDEEAQQALDRAVESEDIDDLQIAIEACVERGIRLNGADALLAKLQEEEEVRESAALALQAAIDAGESTALKRALAEAVAAGVGEWLIEKAEECINTFEVTDKRKRNALVELHLASRAKDIPRFQAALAGARQLGLPVEDQEADFEGLRGAISTLLEAVKARELEPLKSALQNVQHQLLPPLRQEREEALSVMCPVTRSYLTDAQATLAELEEESVKASAELEKREVERNLRAAAEGKDWEGLIQAQQRAADVQLDESNDALVLARETLEALREGHDLEEARQTVEAVEQKLEDLRKQELLLAGAAHKKERSAVGKKIMSCKNDEAYISAQRYLKDPKTERERRMRDAEARQQREEEKRLEWERRSREAAVELTAALEQCDTDAIRGLLQEDVLDSGCLEAAERYLAEEAERIKEAKKDAAICEFRFVGVEKRAFFTASIAVSEVLMTQFQLQEGLEFKLKVVPTSNSVFIACRDEDIARSICQGAEVAIAAACKGSSQDLAVLKKAELRTAGSFADVAEATLQSLRKETELLLAKEPRTLTTKSKTVMSTGTGSNLSRLATWATDATEPEAPPTPDAQRAQSTSSTAGRPSKLPPGLARGATAYPTSAAWRGWEAPRARPIEGAGAGDNDIRANNSSNGNGSGNLASNCAPIGEDDPGLGLGPRTPATSSTARPFSYAAAAAAPRSSASATAAAAAAAAASSAAGKGGASSSSSTAKGAKGCSQGKGARTGGSQDFSGGKKGSARSSGWSGGKRVEKGYGTGAGAEPTYLTLPEGAGTILRQGKLDDFRGDLRFFSKQHWLEWELDDQLQYLTLWHVRHAEIRQSVFEELNQLLNHYFPEEAAHHPPGARRVYLRVHPETGAGVELAPTPQGFLVEEVEEIPGQDFLPGELLVEIDGVSLVNLSNDDLEDAFGAHFGDGVELMVMSSAVM